MQLELHFLEPGCNVWAIGEWANVDFPAFGMTFRWWIGIIGMWQDVRLVADDEVARQLDATHAFGRCGRHVVDVGGRWRDGAFEVEVKAREERSRSRAKCGL